MPQKKTQRGKPSEKERLLNITEYERPLWEQGLVLGGVDEVGRGPLAGPVMAACVVLPKEPLLEGINDSKKLSEKRRNALYESIMKLALGVGIGVCDEKMIDDINIRQATLQAMRMAVMDAGADFLLVDGVDKAVLSADIPQISIAGGDARSYLIGAASIVAKVKRDALMCRLDEEFPQYGFARNKGYGTKEHIEAIRKYGLCKYHRRCFTGNFV
ncbi:MAG: ribonuclease HII [Christensenellales bacterium]|jgi:ribonuclease HII